MKSIYEDKNRKKIDLNMTSMIDVIFLLLIFFIFTTNFDAVEKLLPANLGFQGTILQNDIIVTQEERDLGEIYIRILMDEKGENFSWRINQRSCNSLDQVGHVLRQLANALPEVPVIIDPDRKVPIENVLDIYDICRKNGLVKIQFAVAKKK